ncbi:hypothetical protein DPMN_016869 [Dreissena polymorpha]|uniref:Uncharacterized protein n=1 Tax=Dreissena polymorpha TaxID=45954 RepID=A0A9D4S5V9_DREPO|nr:hypothetical protein DPMN_016869 [Dreissena polymorpha]
MSANKQGANNKPNNKKRTKDEASPGSISDQPDKCSHVPISHLRSYQVSRKCHLHRCIKQ